MQSELSEKMLLRLMDLKRPSFTIPTTDIFDPPNELKPLSCLWFKGLSVSSAEFRSQVFIIIIILYIPLNLLHKIIKYTKSIGSRIL